MLLNPKTKSSTTTNTNNTTKPPATSAIAKAFPPSSYPGLSTDPFNVSSTGSNSSSSSRGAIVPPGGNLRNVMGFRDLGGLGSGNSNGNSGRAVSGIKTTTPSRDGDWGRGSTLISSSSFSSRNVSISSSPEGEVDRKHLRDIWAKRFGNNTAGGGGGGGDDDKGSGFGDKRNNNDKSQGE